MTYGEYIMNSKELYHHGVLGMRWGIRRYQDYPPGKHGTFLGQSRDDDIRIKKGTTAYRVQNQAKLSDKAGQMYASISTKDNLSYAYSALTDDGNVAMDFNMNNGNNGKPYSIRMKFQEDIVAPSYRKSMEAFCRTFDNIKMKNVAKKLDISKPRLKRYVEHFKEVGVKDARDQSYLLFMGQMMNDSKYRTKFLDDLKSQGYNAIIDDWDTQFGKGYTDTPIIIFDRNKSAKQTGTLPLTDKIMDVLTDDLHREKYGTKDLENFYKDKDWKKHGLFEDEDI